MPDEYRFRGFSKPTYTQVPDEFFDELMVHLSEAELRVLLYVMRRTFGFKKDADAISINQMVSGITTKDGTILDRGCGLGRTAVKKGVAGLIEKRVLSVKKIQAENGEYETNVYSLVFAPEEPVGRIATRGRSRNDPPIGRRVTHPRSRRDLGVGRQVTLQETVGQTVNNKQNGITHETEIGKTPEEWARRFEQQEQVLGRARKLRKSQ